MANLISDVCILREDSFYSSLQAPFEVTFSSSSSEDLGFHNNILWVDFLRNLSRFFCCPGDPEFRNRYTFLFKKGVANIFVDVKKPPLLNLRYFSRSSRS